MVGSMNPDLQTLIELQQLDATIAELHTEVQSLPQRIAQVESQLAEHIQAVEASKKNLAENQRGRRKRENDIAALREKISHYRDQTLEVKTNEQYKALLHEIEFHEAGITKLEDEILAEMIDSESLEKKLRETERSLAEERSRTEKEVAEAKQRQQQDEVELQASRTRRAQFQSRLQPAVYEQYEQIARARKGLAVVEVQDEACGACHVRLRPQAYAEARTNEQILNCESCARILYYVAAPAAE